MSWLHPTRIKETSTTTGPGTLTLIAPANNNLRRFNTRWGSGSNLIYVIAGPTYQEIGVGTLTVSGGTHTLSRDYVVSSSNSDSLVSLPAGTHDVFPYEPAGSMPVLVFSGTLSLTLADTGNAAIFTGSSTATLNLPALASTPDGWGVPFKNAGTADFVIDPSGSELIDGVTTQTVAPGEGGFLIKRGSQWTTIAPFGAAYTALANTFTANQLISSTAAWALQITAVDSGAGALGAIALIHDSSSPAAGDILNSFEHLGKDSAGNVTNYASMYGEIVSPTNGAEIGRARWRATRGGTARDWFNEGGRIYYGTLTVPGTDGQINTTGYQLNNVDLPNQRSFVSADQTITSGGLIQVAHGLGVAPGAIDVRLALVCVTANNGWAVDDVVALQVGHLNIGSTGNMGTAIYTDATNINIRIGLNAGAFPILNKTTGAAVQITNANWRLRIKAYV